MLLIKRMPRLLRWISAVLLLFLASTTLLRLVFLFSYAAPGKTLLPDALLMGIRFDLKFGCILALFMLLLCAVPAMHPFKKRKAAGFWNVFLSLLWAILLLVYAVDYYHYDYVQQRLNANILSYFKDAAITLNMGLESYPVFSVMAGVILFSVLMGRLLAWLLHRYQTATVLDKRKGAGWYVLFFLAFSLGIFGKFGQFNLRWSDAFTLGDPFQAQLALNPFQSFFSTLSYRDTRPDPEKVKASYPLIADFLGVQHPDSHALNFERQLDFPPDTRRPNVVLVICESFSMFRSSMAGNPLHTTPYFSQLCKDGVFYNRCFTPSFPTARGVWATLTAIPDVLGDNNRTASRNPEVVNQQTILNQLTGYAKYYFIGGDPTWANIKGVLLNNIDSLKLYSQDDFKAPKVDVWGIDDKSLLLESAEILSAEKRPFFAIIQTADNHRPYTIPAVELQHFKKLQLPADSLHRYGFEDNDEFNAFRYTDYTFEKFMEKARQQPWFANTLFVFVGDHGMPGNADALYPECWGKLSLTRHHVPLLFYAPKWLPAAQHNGVCSQLDIMPSIATLLQAPHRNTGLGQSLFDPRVRYQPAVFTIDHELGTYGMITDSFYYQQNRRTGQTAWVSTLNNDPVTGQDSLRNRLAQLTEAYYQAAKYLLYNNKRKGTGNNEQGRGNVE